MSGRDGQRGRGRGGRGRGTAAQERNPQPFPSQGRAPGGRSGGAPPQPQPQPQPQIQPSDIRDPSSSTISRELGERLQIGSSSGSIQAPVPPRPSQPTAASTPESGSAAPGSSLPPVSSKALVFPSRPGFGTVGMKCRIRANHFVVKAAAKNVFQYEIKIDPEVKSRAASRALMNKLIEQFGESHLSGRLPAYDGRNILYTAGSLPFTSNIFELNFSYKDGREKTYKISIKFAKDFDLYSLNQFLQGRQRECPYDTITALDVVLREFPAQNYVTVSRSFFSSEFGSSPVGDGVECWRGYFQSLRPTQLGLTLNVDLSATSFFKSVNLIVFVLEYLNLQSVPPGGLQDRQRLQLQKALKGVRVETTHVNNMPRRYRITALTPLPASKLMFTIDEGKVETSSRGAEISVAKYFRDNYGALRFEFLPCIKAGNDNKPTYLPMEVCNIVGGQRYIKKLNEKQVTQILRSACQRPADKERSIIQLVKRNNYNLDKHAKQFSITVDPNLTTIEARILPPPRLKYHDSGREKMCHPSVGQWNMLNKRMIDGGSVDAWACINFSRLGGDVVENFCHALVSVCNNIGLSFNPNPVDVYSRPPSQLENSLREMHTQSVEALKRMNAKHKQLQLLIIVLPDTRSLYGTVKRICETELGIISQCCMPKNLSKCNDQYLKNLSLKINVKVGGRNTVLEDALNKRIPLVSDAPTIIFGADVTHPAPGEDSMCSIAAVVASMDWPWVTKYRGLVSAQPHRQEIIEDLFKIDRDPQRGNVAGGMIRELLVAFYKETRTKPHRIIFYRDGVSESQFKDVLLLEMDAIRKACASLQEGYLPPVTFVVVQKRHHTRLFPENHNNRDMMDRSGNILPGTIVDRAICHPTEFDFFLCSHAGIQGTSRPAHYHVLYDENKFTADGLQVLTNNLCYTFARCTRSVSIVPPAFYAHLAAFRARYYIEGESDSGSGPSSRGVTRDSTAVASSRLPTLMENIKDVMFYC
ncbi:Protein argonaute MEL1 [Platanthera guangdongensis]|uniref:Protein argonaute MEL1 n=1 Tax=Platanthera guangdongensis TaxID=2320717 RepID=A0ABR2MIY7_9ASPA